MATAPLSFFGPAHGMGGNAWLGRLFQRSQQKHCIGGLVVGQRRRSHRPRCVGPEHPGCPRQGLRHGPVSCDTFGRSTTQVCPQDSEVDSAGPYNVCEAAAVSVFVWPLPAASRSPERSRPIQEGTSGEICVFRIKRTRKTQISSFPDGGIAKGGLLVLLILKRILDSGSRAEWKDH